MNRSERGSAAVEAALILPVVILIMIGIFEYGVYFLRMYMYEQAVFAGARAGAIEDVNKNSVAQSEALRVLGDLGIAAADAPAIDVQSDIPGPVAGTTLIRVRIDTAYTPIIGYSSVILPARIRAVSSTLNY